MGINFLDRSNLLKQIFLKSTEQKIENSPLEIKYFNFVQNKIDNDLEKVQNTFDCIYNSRPDNFIDENRQFSYPIFVHQGKTKYKSVIILMHGLNERSWEKYLCWAEYLALNTGKPVIMFPFAFHINRTPNSWNNPRALMPWVNERKNKNPDNENLTFANITLSDRLTMSPLRFFASGKETALNLWQLLSDINEGKHPLFEKGTKADFFAYSIGAMLSQVMLIANPDKLLSNSRLFMFCGGSIFKKMNGNSRYIMDKQAFNKIFNYYQCQFINQNYYTDKFAEAFKTLIDAEKYTNIRNDFFTQSSHRIKVISLKKDVVIPTEGIKDALGKECADKTLTEIDFPFEYSHENPFPLKKAISKELDLMFSQVFSVAADFLM